MGKLTEAMIDAAPAGVREVQLIDGDGLRLRVLPKGAKTWVVRTNGPAGVKQATLGPYPTLSLTQARVKAAEARQAAGTEDGRGDLHGLARDWVTAGVDLVNGLHAQLDRAPTVDDVLRVLRSMPRAAGD